MKEQNIQFQENPSSKNRADKCRRTDVTEVAGAFRAYANAPKNQTSVRVQETILVLRNKQIFYSCIYLTEQCVVLRELAWVSSNPGLPRTSMLNV